MKTRKDFLTAKEYLCYLEGVDDGQNEIMKIYRKVYGIK
jgi:hypothetical protein